ncbi:MAG: hypothetical protein ABI671_09465 [Burkholderiales bacterium]
MLESIKRLFARPAPERDLAEVSAWAQRTGRGFKRVRGEDGFVIDGAIDGMPWRLEWGPPQRDYIGGHELRLRMELTLPHDMQMLVLSRTLLEKLERATYEQFTDSMQTQIGAQAPEEMRWLVMFPKIDLASLKALRARFGAVASVPAAGLAWIEGPLAEALERSGERLLRSDPPFVLMTLRSRIYLRMLLDTPDPAEIAAALAIFETAVVQALAAATGFDGRNGQWHSTSSTAWQSLHSEELQDLSKPG